MSRPEPRRALLPIAVAVLLAASSASATTVADVQYTTDPTGASPLDGQQVTVEATVYALYPPRAFAMADAAGPWNGIYVYLNPNPGTLPVAVGDRVSVTGTVQEYYELTEIVCAAGGVSVLATGETPPAASVVTTAEIATGAATAESYEGVLVEVQDVQVTATPNQYGEWFVDDGSGAVMVDDLADYAYDPTLGEVLDHVRGMLFYNFDDFKIEPRDDGDIQQQPIMPVARTVAEIQGDGFASPVADTAVETTGVVTGFFEGNIPGGGSFDAFVLQDPVGDGDPATSEGLMVVASGLPGSLAVGDAVTVTGMVREYSEYDGTSCQSGCMTTVFATSWSETGTGAVTPVLLAPPTDTDGQNDYLESLEGMLVALDGDGIVVGPTSFGTIAVVDADEGVTRVLRGSVQHGRTVGVRHWERFGDVNGADPPNLIVGSSVTGVGGPLVTTYGDSVVATQAGDAWSVVASLPPPATPPTWGPPTAGQFTAASLNCERMDDGAGTKLAKVVDSIVALGCPTFLALQEVDTESTLPGGEDDALPELLSALSVEGCAYAAANSHPDVGDHGVAALWRTDLVGGATWTIEHQGCSAVGSSSSSQYDDYCDSVPGQEPLFSRRPVVLTGTLTDGCGGGPGAEVAFIALHLKSKVGGDPADDQRRLEQAQLVAGLVDTLVAGGTPNVVVAGDLNDFEDSAPLAALVGGGRLVNAWDLVDPSDRYSYNFGGVSQILDHVLVTPALWGAAVVAGPLHHNADFPFRPYATDAGVLWRTSDHDPLAATFGACGGFFADGFESGGTTAWSSAIP